MNALPDGLIVFAKRDCPTCVMVAPVLRDLAGRAELTVYSQDDPTFPEGVANVIDDSGLEQSFRQNIEIVPTLIRIEGGREIGRTYGWDRDDWRALSGSNTLGEGLPASRPGCGSKSLEPGVAEDLAFRFGPVRLAARQIEISDLEDAAESCFDRGWSDGLPVVPPTPARVLRMLQGTSRQPGEVIGLVPPDLVPCTVEKVAINAVLAGCKPEYLPVVLAAVEAALIDEFCMHGLLCTTMFGSPLVLVNGPIAKAIGMNSGVNALGQGNRANATIGRALQLVIRNVGGGKPGGIDRSTLGNPGKYTFCFAEDESDDLWEPLSVERGFAHGTSTVTLFPGEGVQGIVDQKSRSPESLARSFAACLRTVDHPKLAMAGDAMLVVSPDHCRVFFAAGWSKARLRLELEKLLLTPGRDLIVGAGGIDEGVPASLADSLVPKFRPGGLLIVRAGGKAGLFSAIIAGWAASGQTGSVPVSKEITP